jgi:hypothetical protein
MNRNLEQAVIKTLREIEMDVGIRPADEAIARLASNFVEIEKQEKEFRFAVESGGLEEWFNRRYRRKNDGQRPWHREQDPP